MMEDKEFEELVDMFTSKGWKSFMSSVTDLEGILVNASPDNAVTNDQWQFARGQIYQLRSIIGYEGFIKMSQEQQDVDTV